MKTKTKSKGRYPTPAEPIIERSYSSETKALEHMSPSKAQLNTRLVHGNLNITIGQLTEEQAKLALYIREKQVIKLLATLETIWSKAERAYMNI